MAPFAFPPPPPPPPKAQADGGEAYSLHSPNGGRSRGRGRGNRGGRRGRSQYGASENRPLDGAPGRYSLNSWNGNGSLQLQGNAAPSSAAAQIPDQHANQAFNHTNIHDIGQQGSRLGMNAHFFPSAFHGMQALHTNAVQAGHPAMPFSHGVISPPPYHGVKDHRDKLSETNSSSRKERRPRIDQYSSFGNSSNHSLRNRGRLSAGAHHVSSRPKVETAPSVPSFGLSLPVFAPPTASNVVNASSADNEASSSNKTKRKRKINQLGLTPQSDTHEASEDDLDEEIRLSSAVHKAGNIEFDYKGIKTSLGSATDLAAWIAERKKRFPTQARVEARKLEQKKDLQDRLEAQKKLNEMRRLEKEQRQKEWNAKALTQALLPEPSASGKDFSDKEKRIRTKEEKTKRSLEKHLAKAEKLKRRLQKAENKAIEAKAAEKIGAISKIDDEDLDEFKLALRKTDGGLSSVQDEILEVEIHTLLANTTSPDDVIGFPIAQGAAQTFPLAQSTDQSMTPTTVYDSGEPESTISNLKSECEGPSLGSPVTSIVASETVELHPSNSVPTLSDNHVLSQTHLVELAELDESGSPLSSDSSMESETDDSSDISSSSSENSDSAILSGTSSPKPIESQNSTFEETKPPAQKVCHFFAQHARCKYGAKCQYSHSSTPDSARVENARAKRQKRSHEDVNETQRLKRKTLFQRLLEGEQMEEARNILDAIKTLGDAGWLE